MLADGTGTDLSSAIERCFLELLSQTWAPVHGRGLGICTGRTVMNW